MSTIEAPDGRDRAVTDSAGAAPADAGGCGCGSGSGSGTMAGPRPPTAAETTAAPPIACALSGGEMKDRIADWQALLAAVERREALAGGLRLTFEAPAPLSEITRLAAAEHDCCPFFGFAVTIDGRGVGLEVTAPAGGQVLLESVFGATPAP